jgi:hypothetical protein
MMVGDMDPEPDTFIVWDGVCGPSSPFRRATRAREELASYFQCARRADGVDVAFLGSNGM